MIGEIRKERIDSIEAPYNRQVWFDDVEFESGMKLIRVTIREGRRITQLDVDADTARNWAQIMSDWAEQNA